MNSFADVKDNSIFAGCDNVFDEIRTLNKVWGNELPPIPVLRPNPIFAMTQFDHILSEEMNEFREISLKWQGTDGYSDLDMLTDLSDWFGDMIVYLVGEAAKYGIRIEDVVGIINDSNASKMGPNGEVYRNPTTLKVEKGPNFFRPEPAINGYLADLRKNHETHLV